MDQLRDRHLYTGIVETAKLIYETKFAESNFTTCDFF